MFLLGSRIRMRGARKAANPEGGRISLEADQWLYVGPVFYPGEIYMEDRTAPKWSFWTNADIDGAFIFNEEDIAELEVPAHYDLPDAFTNTPFIVTRSQRR